MSPEALVSDPHLLAALLGWATTSTEQEDVGAAAALEVLVALAGHPEVAAQLLALGADQAVCRIQDSLPGDLSRLADQLLVEIYMQRRAEEPDKGGGGSACYTVPSSGRGEVLSQRLISPVGPDPSLVAPQPARDGHVSLPGGERVPLLTDFMPASPERCSTNCTRISGRDEAVLAQHGLQVRAVPLLEEDLQQLQELACQLARPTCEAGVEMALLQLRAGVLADVPAAGLVGTDIMSAVLGLLESCGAASPLLPSALSAVHGVMQRLVDAVAECGDGSCPATTVPIAPLAHAVLVTCSQLLVDVRLHHVTVPLLLDVLPLTCAAEEQHPGEEAAAAFCSSWRRALAPLAQALHLAMVGRY